MRVSGQYWRVDRTCIPPGGAGAGDTIRSSGGSKIANRSENVLEFFVLSQIAEFALAANRDERQTVATLCRSKQTLWHPRPLRFPYHQRRLLPRFGPYIHLYMSPPIGFGDSISGNSPMHMAPSYGVIKTHAFGLLRPISADGSRSPSPFSEQPESHVRHAGRRYQRAYRR